MNKSMIAGAKVKIVRVREVVAVVLREAAVHRNYVDHLLWMVVGQRPKHYSVHYAEGRKIDANSQRQRYDGRDGEATGFGQLPAGDAYIPPHIFNHQCGILPGNPLLDHRPVPKAHICIAPRVVWQHTIRDVVVDAHLNV